jgi:hypothetical protein
MQHKLYQFLGLSLVALLVLMVPWYFAAPWLGVPAIEIAGAFMKGLFAWVQGVERQGTMAVLLTQVPVWVPAQGRLVVADMTPEASFLTYGYGMALLWALVLASRPVNWPRKLLLGTLLLVPLQAMALCFHWLRMVAFQGGALAQQATHLSGWQLEAIAYGYQFSFLMLTPLAPVILWAWMEPRVRQVFERRSN